MKEKIVTKPVAKINTPTEIATKPVAKYPMKGKNATGNEK